MSKEESDELYFVVFLINHLADKLDESVSSIYKKLKSVNAISDYIIPCYDVLHTQGAEYLMEDLQEYAKLRGVTLWWCTLYIPFFMPKSYSIEKLEFLIDSFIWVLYVIMFLIRTYNTSVVNKKLLSSGILT